MNKISSQEYCRNFVRDQDYNLYLLHFFTPKQRRRALIGLMALHCELKLIPIKTTEPHMRLIRRQWWRDEIEKIMDCKPHAQSPILEELRLHDLSDADLESYLSAVDTDQMEEAFYNLLIKVSDYNPRLIKKISLHKKMSGDTGMRALRLWLGI